jgi:hypothetical protein
MDLEDLAMIRSLGEESCPRLVEKDMEYHVVIVGVLTVPVLLPIEGAKIELDVALELRVAVDPDAGPDEVWPRFPVPEAELHDLNESAVRRVKAGTACSRVPESLPLQFGPLVLPEICGFADQGELRLEALQVQSIDSGGRHNITKYKYVLIYRSTGELSIAIRRIKVGKSGSFTYSSRRRPS